MSRFHFKRREDRETLERIKRWPSLKERFKRVRIFSAEHGYFWRGTGQGYTSNPLESEILDISEAYKMTNHCGPEKHIHYVNAL